MDNSKRMTDYYSTTSQDWFNFTSQNYNSNALAQYVITSDKPLDYDLLINAMKCYLCEEPLLGCVFTINKDHPVWTQVVPDLYSICRNDASSIMTALSERIDVVRECPVKIRLVNGNNIVIKTHHALCDGRGSLQFVQNIARIYSALERGDYAKSQPMMSDRGIDGFFDSFGITDKPSRFDPSKLDMRSTWGTPFGDNQADQTFDCSILRLQKDDVERMKKYAKDNGGTLNALLTAAYYRALVALIKPSGDTREIQFTVDLRRFMGTNVATHSLCNRSTIMNLWLPVRGDLKASMQIAKKAFEAALGSESFIQNILACDLLETVGYDRSEQLYANDWDSIRHTGLCSPMISNVGRLDGEPISFGDAKLIDMYLVSPAFVGPSFMFSVSTYKEVMTFCVAYYKPSTDACFVKRLLDAIERILVNEVKKA